MAHVCLVQHAEKEPTPGDPGLTGIGRELPARTAQWLRGKGISAVHSSPPETTVPAIASTDHLRF